MKTSGTGKAGALLIAVGAAAVGIAGCGTSGDKSTTAADKAATVVSTTTPGPSTPAPSTADTPAAATTQPSSTAPSTTAATSPSSAPSTPAMPSTTKPAPTKPTTSATHAPTPVPAPAAHSAQLGNIPLGSNTPGALDPRCMTGRVACIDMKTRTLVWVIDGVPQYGFDVRFGDENNPTRLGSFDIYMKMKDCVSTIYHTPMPYAMFFSGGEAIHFSIDFATYGYAHHSHGCVNVRDKAAVERLFADTKIGDKVVVYAG